MEEKLDKIIELLNQENYLLREISQNTRFQVQHLSALYRHEILLQPRYQEEKRLIKYGKKIFSQNDEDGIIAEIFNRISTNSKTFFEFGAHTTENNSLALLANGWKGTWLEGNESMVHHMQHEYQPFIEQGQLTIQHAMITKNNINELLEKYALSPELDLLSIDVDGNDLYIWKAISPSFKPRVIVIEYNALFLPSTVFVQHDEPDRVWDTSSHSGASLKALELMAEQKGYALVGCGFNGVNAFFVRKDLLGNHFAAPYTSENHYEPIRYSVFHTLGWAGFESVGHRAKLRTFENQV
jgi:hypothetical protein